jgi:peptide/nickel transport system permease protein
MNQRRRTKFVWALWFLIGLHVVVLLAGFFAPYSYDSQDREHPYAAPMRVHLVDAQGHWHLRPFAYGIKSREGSFSAYEEDHSKMLPLKLFAAGEPYQVLGRFHFQTHLFGVEPRVGVEPAHAESAESPARVYLLGADGFGRDQLSRVLYGGQVSLFAGILAATFSVVAGLFLGLVAGMFGRPLDDVIMRVGEIFIALPWLYLLISVRAFLPLQMSSIATFTLVVAVIGLVGWGRPARLVRGVVLSARERNFVLAARGFGAGRFYLMRRHILPATLGVALTQMALLVPLFMMAEVTLSFLGLGVGEPYPSWGNMLASAQQFHVISSYWWMLLPGLAPAPVFLACHALADSLQEKLQSAV